MMNRKWLLPLALVSSLLVVGCQNYQYGVGERQVVGTVVGGVAGGLLGATIGAGTGQVIAAASGALLGGIIGHEIGRRMDETDKYMANQAFKRATSADIGHNIYWENAPTGHSGSVRPIRDGMSSHGLYCREFQSTVYIDGRTEKMYGTACRQRDGSWVVI